MERVASTKYEINRVKSISLSQANARGSEFFYFGEKEAKKRRKGGNSGEKSKYYS